jgi:hypothetical protein
MSDLSTGKPPSKMRRKGWLMLASAALAIIGSPSGTGTTHAGPYAGGSTRDEAIQVNPPAKPVVDRRDKLQAKQGPPPDPDDLEHDPSTTLHDTKKQGGLLEGFVWSIGHAALHAAKEPHTHPETEEPPGRPESESSGSE